MVDRNKATISEQAVVRNETATKSLVPAMQPIHRTISRLPYCLLPVNHYPNLTIAKAARADATGDNRRHQHI